MKKTIRKIPLIFAMMGLLAVSLLGCSSSGEPSSAPSDASAVSIHKPIPRKPAKKLPLKQKNSKRSCISVHRVILKSIRTNIRVN